VAQKRLDEQFAFLSSTPIIGNLNRLLTALEGRFGSLEEQRDSLADAEQQLREVALNRLNQTIAPIVEEIIGRVQTLGAMFTAEATLDTATIGPQVWTFYVDEGQRNSFAHLGYVTARPLAADDIGMAGDVIAYNVATGALEVEFTDSWGEGTFTGWELNATIPPDAYMRRRDNPHEVTAHQAGAYTQGEIDTKLSDLSTYHTEAREDLDAALRKYAKKQAIVFG